MRQLKRYVATLGSTKTIRVAGIDDWSWRKGFNYGTIIVGLEHRKVVDVLPDRSAAGTASWLNKHPEVEVVSRDRCGLYAQLNETLLAIQGRSSPRAAGCYRHIAGKIEDRLLMDEPSVTVALSAIDR